MQCPNCQSDVPDGMDFCVNCGTDLPNAQAASPDDAPASAPPPVPDADARAALQSTSRKTIDGEKCPACGATNPPEAMFCSLCSIDLKPKTASDAASLPVPDASAPLPPDAPAPPDMAGAQGRQEASQLHRAMMEGDADAMELARLAELEFQNDRKEDAARYLIQAIYKDPKAKGWREFYLREFDERDLKEWGLGHPPEPIWSSIHRIVLYPVEKGEWINVILSGFFVAFFMFVAQYAWLVGLALVIFALSWVATCIGKHMKWAALGKFGHPRVVDMDMSYIWHWILSGVAAAWPSILVVLFVFAIHPAVAILFLVTIPLGILIAPMCLLVAMLFNNGWEAFSYGFILRSIFRIFLEYFFACVLLYGISIGVGFAKQVFLIAILAGTPQSLVLVVQILFGFVHWTFNMYFYTAYARILGLLYYNNRDKLAWF